MERTVTISLAEYELLKEARRLSDVRVIELDARVAELEVQLRQIRDIVAPAEESEPGSEPEPESNTITLGFWAPKSDSPPYKDLLNYALGFGGSH